MNRPARNTLFGCVLCVILAVFYGCSAQAAALTLVCKGELTIYGQGSMKIDESGAVIDLERAVFKVPQYGDMALTSIDETSVSFGRETAKYSITGGLDRLSGHLTMSVMPPSERKKLSQGQGAKFTAYMDAKCHPAKKMF